MTLEQLIFLVATAASVCAVTVFYALMLVWHVAVRCRVDVGQLDTGPDAAFVVDHTPALQVLSAEALEDSYGDVSLDTALDALRYQAERFVSHAVWLGPLSKLCMFLGMVCAFAAMHWQQSGVHGVLGLSRAAVEATALYWGLSGLTFCAAASSSLLALRKRLGREIEAWQRHAEPLLAKLYGV